LLSDQKFLKNNYILTALSIILGVIVSSGIILLPDYAYAHSLPVTENPARNSIIPKGAPLPSKLTIDFSERPSPTVSSIQVLNSKNEPVNTGNFVIIGDYNREAMTTLDTKKLTDGVYTVTWQTQSLDDGHIAKGSYVFGIGNVGPSAVASILSGKTSQQAIQTQSVTSTLDGFVKWPMIVSQAAIVGGIFSHLFLWQNFGSKIGGTRVVGYGFGYDRANMQLLRRFFIILMASSVAILAAGTSYLFLQVTELSTHNTISAYWSTFMSQIPGASGTQWIMRSITSLIVITAIIGYYYITKRNILIESGQNRRDGKEENNSFKNHNKTTSLSSLLYIALVAGSISIFANSITSHNAGVHFIPSLSISLDWLHFMAVSIWVGGLFYISSVLLTAIRTRATTTIKRDSISTGRLTRGMNHPMSDSEKIRSVVVYYLALLLPRFSLLATVSLGVIGVSGLYMAWTQLHSLNALFTSAYGNILIIKLSTALPLVLLGAYHQLSLHRSTVLVASQGRGRIGGGGSTTAGGGSSENIPVSRIFADNDVVDASDKSNKSTKDKGKIQDITSKFSKTIKIESLIAIGVLLAASVLTITSPPLMNMSSMAASMSSSSSTTSMSGMSMTPAKNSTYVAQTKILNVNTKMEINPFYAGFNFFKVTFTDANGKPNTKVNAVEMTFINTAANMGPIVANLQKTGPGVFSVTGAYISQPGEWDIAMAAQRVQDLDLNYEFTANVTNPPSQAAGGSSGTTSPAGATLNQANSNSMQEPLPKWDSFAWLAIGLALAVVFGSAFYYGRSKQELRKTIEMLNND
jgi:copper transport protein